VSEVMQGGVGERANEQRQAEGIGMRNSDFNRLDGTLADAVIPLTGALLGG
jgi:hypothetical protein